MNHVKIEFSPKLKEGPIYRMGDLVMNRQSRNIGYVRNTSSESIELEVINFASVNVIIIDKWSKNNVEPWTGTITVSNEQL